MVEPVGGEGQGQEDPSARWSATNIAASALLGSRCAVQSLVGTVAEKLPVSSVKVFPRPQQTPSGELVFADRWGITRYQLRDYFDMCQQRDEWNDADNVRTFVEKFVIPETLGTGMGLALLLNIDAPKEVNLMISHTWEENARLFFEDVLERARDGEVLFVCFLALYQAAFAPCANVEAFLEDGAWHPVTIAKTMPAAFLVTWLDDDGNPTSRELPAQEIRRPRIRQWIIYQEEGFRNPMKHIFQDEGEARRKFSRMPRRHSRILVDQHGREVEHHVGMCNAALADVREHFKADWRAFEGDEPSLLQQIGDTVSNGPFASVINALLRTNGRMIVVTNDACPLYSRLWCVWEIYCASLNGIPVDFVRRGRLFSSSISLRDANCSNKNDRQQIKDAVVAKLVPTYGVTSSRLKKAQKVLALGGGILALPAGLPAAFFTGFLLHKLSNDKRDGWMRLESVVRVVAQKADMSSDIFASMQLERAVYQSYDVASGCSNGSEDVTEWVNHLMQGSGAADFTGGRCLYEVLGVSIAAGVGELVVLARGHEEIFVEKNAFGILKKYYDLRPFLTRAWSCEPPCFKVVKATYGSLRFPNRCCDVTEMVNQLIEEHGVRNFTGGRTLAQALDVSDPAIGEKKELIITALACHTEVFRTRKFSKFVNNKHFDLEKQGLEWHRNESGDLVERAVYKSMADPVKQVDVTDRVNVLCDENILSDFTRGEMLDHALGVDPAPGEAKELVLTLRRPFTRVLRDPVIEEETRKPVVFDLRSFFERTLLRHV
eukprot:TRINITY_DN17870_c0_g2_i1.p1 TRINITY_DN17870_c0_g2~~TRINITY_DN17870_c0_g2_i1.p1  ORF type:complete len:774 (+),score=114.27 TRINITY_DN17870_c0_g2_i1:84-2405(+)